MMTYLLALLPLKNFVVFLPVKVLIPTIILLNLMLSGASKLKFYINKDFIYPIYFIPFSYIFNRSPDISSSSIYLSLGAFFVIFFYIRGRQEFIAAHAQKILFSFLILHLISILLQANFDITAYVEQVVLVRNENYIRMSGFGYINDNSFLFGLIFITAIMSGSYYLACLSGICSMTSITGAMVVGVSSSFIFSRLAAKKYIFAYALFLLFLVFLIFIFFSHLDLGDNFVGERLLSLKIRVIFWSHVMDVYFSSLDLWSFLFGCGPACSRQMMTDVQYGTTHSNYIGVFIDYGFLGFVFWLKLIFRLAQRNIHIATYCITFGVTHEYYYVVSNLVFIYLSGLCLDRVMNKKSS